MVPEKDAENFQDSRSAAPRRDIRSLLLINGCRSLENTSKQEVFARNGVVSISNDVSSCISITYSLGRKMGLYRNVRECQGIQALLSCSSSVVDPFFAGW